MAIAFDANLGATSTIPPGATVSFTTTSAAAANARVIVDVSWFQSGASKTVASITVGGTALAQDKHATNGSDLFDRWSGHFVGGVASGSTVLVTFTNALTLGGVLVTAASFTGIATTAAVVTTGSSNTTGANWSSGSATNTGQANALYYGGAGNEDATNPTTSTATSGTEVHDRYDAPSQQGIVTGYKIVSTVASDSITGTFSNSGSTANTGALVIYASDGSGGGGTTVKQLAALGVG